MDNTTVSSKFQVVIPLRIRRLMRLKPGQKVQVIAFQNRIELIPVQPVQSARGFLRGIKTDIDREEDRL
jgi:AbrB family looped-hinge helix DNA binding protein